MTRISCFPFRSGFGGGLTTSVCACASATTPRGQIKCLFPPHLHQHQVVSILSPSNQSPSQFNQTPLVYNFTAPLLVLHFSAKICLTFKVNFNFASKQINSESFLKKFPHLIIIFVMLNLIMKRVQQKKLKSEKKDVVRVHEAILF